MAKNYALLMFSFCGPGTDEARAVRFGGSAQECSRALPRVLKPVPSDGPVSAGKVPTHGSIRHSSQPRSALEKNNPLDAHASRDLVLLWLRHPHVCRAA